MTSSMPTTAMVSSRTRVVVPAASRRLGNATTSSSSRMRKTPAANARRNLVVVASAEAPPTATKTTTETPRSKESIVYGEASRLRRAGALRKCAEYLRGSDARELSTTSRRLATLRVDVLASIGCVEEAREVMDAHRNAMRERGKAMGMVTLCAWANAEARAEKGEGASLARSLYREATSVSDVGTVKDACDCWTSFGKYEESHGRVKKARKCFKTALDVVAGSTNASESAAIAAHSWALLEAREKDPRRARELFAQAVKLCETHVANYTAWASFECARGQRERARELLERGGEMCEGVDCAAKSSTGRRNRRMVSALYTSWGDLEAQIALQATRNDDEDASSAASAAPEDVAAKAAMLLERACEVDKKNVSAWLKWSELEKDLARGNSHRGGVVTSGRRSNVSNRRQIEILDEGLRANPGDMRLQHAYAMALKLNGDIEGATKRLRRLSERFASNSHVWHALGTILQEGGDFEGAIEAFERGSFASGKANLPCITAAAAAEFHGGRHGRARQLFVQGEAVPRHLSSRRERAAHLRLWALLEKRVGTEETTRRLFMAATREDRADAATWLQWGQWEKRINSAEAARQVFQDGVKFGVNNGQYFVYQALATLEAEDNNDELARDLFKRGCSAHPRSASLWLQWALFELSSVGDEKEIVTRSIKVIEKGVSRAPPHIPLLELWLGLERRLGNDEGAAKVEAGLNKLLSEQRYAPMGQEVIP